MGSVFKVFHLLRFFPWRRTSSEITALYKTKTMNSSYKLFEENPENAFYTESFVTHTVLSTHSMPVTSTAVNRSTTRGMHLEYAHLSCYFLVVFVP